MRSKGLVSSVLVTVVSDCAGQHWSGVPQLKHSAWTQNAPDTFDQLARAPQRLCVCGHSGLLLHQTSLLSALYWPIPTNRERFNCAFHSVHLLNSYKISELCYLFILMYNIKGRNAFNLQLSEGDSTIYYPF